MTQEELIEKLQHSIHNPSLLSELTLEWVDPNEYGFSRHLKVTTNYGYSFIIEWYRNIITIYPNEYTQIWADDIWLDNCMPNNSKLDLRCSYSGINTGFCIKIINNHNKEV
jgi:hypothetical protein